jgi:hypothetical protein
LSSRSLKSSTSTAADSRKSRSSSFLRKRSRSSRRTCSSKRLPDRSGACVR